MTSSDMQDTPAGREAAGAGGPRSSQPKRRTFTAAYKLAMIGKYLVAAGVLLVVMIVLTIRQRRRG